MDRARLMYLFINVLGGVGVLGSYAHGISTHPGGGDLLWGTLPEAVRPLYTANMPFAAVGYLLTFAFVLSTPPDRLTRDGNSVTGLFSAATVFFLVASTWWMPLCFEALDTGNVEILKWIQLVLAVAGAAALGVWIQLFRLDPVPRPWLRKAAIVGQGFLVLQCTVLDALVWPRFFGIPMPG